MKTTAIIFALIAIASATNHIEDMFSEVMDNEFGNTLVEQIQLELETGARVDQLINSIRDVRDGLRGQLNTAQQVHEENHDACQSDVAEISSSITQAKADIQRNVDAGSFDSDSLASRVQERRNKADELQERQTLLQNLADQRAAEVDRWEQVQHEHRVVENVIEDVRVIIQQRLRAQGGNFLETNTDMFMSISAKLRSFETESKGLAHGYGALFKLLAQMLEQNARAHGDQQTVEHILQLIDRVEENLDNSLALEREAERERAADYEELRDRVQGQVTRVTSQMLELDSEITTLTDRVDMAQQKRKNAEEALARHTDRLQDRQAECAAGSQVWENFYHNISDELSTCGKVLYLLEDKRALLARYGL